MSNVPPPPPFNSQQPPQNVPPISGIRFDAPAGKPAGGLTKALRIVSLIVTLVLAVTWISIYYARNIKDVKIGKDDVMYEDDATRDQATALGNKLKDIGYFKDNNEVTVVLGIKGGKRTIKFVIAEPEKAKSLEAGFGDVARDAAPAVGGTPVTVKLVDKDIHEVDSFEVTGGNLIFGKSNVEYRDDATKDQAQALGNKLKEIGWFSDDSPATVYLSVKNGQKTLSFMVPKTVKDNSSKARAIEGEVKPSLAAIGGPPATIKLIDQDMNELFSFDEK